MTQDLKRFSCQCRIAAVRGEQAAALVEDLTGLSEALKTLGYKDGE
jgi:hypothetical protein